VFRAYDASNRTEFLLGITWWGQVYIAFEGDLRPDPRDYRPVPRTFRPLTADGWASALPTNLEGLSPFEAACALIVEVENGPVLRSLRPARNGALPSAQLDSS
jgi:hypothetical protein